MANKRQLGVKSFVALGLEANQQQGAGFRRARGSSSHLMATQGSTSRKRKRDVAELRAPKFVASDEDGAYDIVEMPKRYMLGYMAEKKYVHDKIMTAYQVMDAKITAMNIRVEMFAADFIRQMKAQDAARAAADGPAGHDPASSV